jgi:RHS repeat-associated protein
MEIDDLVYDYDDNLKNQLVNVTDNTNDPKGFKDENNGTADYDYDANGNMTKDENKFISSIVYNHLNLPTQINFATGDKIEYLYDAIGQKKSKKVTQADTETVTDYLDGYQYTNEVLNFFPHAEGYVNMSYCRRCDEQGSKFEFNYVYNYTDHLGNIRVSYSVDKIDRVLKILEENHYYPFGLKHTNYNSGNKKYYEEDIVQPIGMVVAEAPAVLEAFGKKIIQTLPNDGVMYKYRYNSKEWQDELGLNVYDYGNRMYDPADGRWWQTDEKAEFYVSASPYSYALNNPVNAIDPDGKLVIFVNGYFSRAGNIVGLAPGAPLKPYWDFFSSQAISSARDFLGASSKEGNYFVDGSSYVGFDQSGGDRYENGYEYAEKNYTSIISQMAEGETLKFVGHSEGSAFAAGMMAYFLDRGMNDASTPKVESSLHLSPDEADEFSLPDYGGTDYQIHNDNDPVSPFYELKGTEYIFKGNKSSKSGAHGGTVTKKAINNLKAAIEAFINSSDTKKKETEEGTIYYKDPAEQ